MAATRPLPKRQTQNTVYVHGNTARRLEPQRVPVGQLKPQRTPIRQPERRKDPQTSYRVRRNQEKALQMDLPYLVVLVIAACCALYICVSYIHIQSDMTARMDTIKGLEQDLETLKSENDALETRINTYVDLDYVYKVATEELGMVYANKDQVLLYNKTESEYVRQDEDIPTY